MRITDLGLFQWWWAVEWAAGLFFVGLTLFTMYRKGKKA